MSFSQCVAFAKDTLKVNYNLKENQLATLQALYDGNDCVSILPTGYGKSVIYQLLPWFYQRKRGTQDNLIVVVVSPLTSLMQDQVMSLCEKDIKACYLNNEGKHGKTYVIAGGQGLSDSEEEETSTSDMPVYAPNYVSLSSLRKGLFNIVYAHPETLLNNKQISSMLRSDLYQNNVCAVVVDEVHMVAEWGQSFRTAFKRLAELICIFPSPTAAHLALTATAAPAAVQDLINDLQFENVRIVSMIPDRENIFLEVRTRLPNIKKYEKLDDLLEPLVEELQLMLLEFPLTIVYVNQLEALGYCYQYTDAKMKDNAYVPIGHSIPENRIFAQFHKDYTVRMKDHIVCELRKPNPKLRLVFATVALGMGLDAPSINRVIHFQPPTTIEKYFQEIGRAGRNGQPAVAIMYYNMSDIATNRPGMTTEMRNYCTNKTSCLRRQLMQYFGFQDLSYKGPLEFCCINCRNTQ